MLAYAPSVTAPRPGAHRLQVRIRFRSQYGCEVRLVTPRDSSKPKARQSADQVLIRDNAFVLAFGWTLQLPRGRADVRCIDTVSSARCDVSSGSVTAWLISNAKLEA